MMAAHTCDQSLLAVGDPSNAYIYRPRTRGFGFRQCVSEISINEYDWKEGTIDLLRTVGVWYCPWCGEVLPGRLNRIYFRLIEQVLGPDEYVVFRHCEELPAEFLDDTWWRTRGIPSDIGKRCSKDERTYDNDSMIVADSCYSGSLTRGLRLQTRDEAYIQRLARKRARVVLTSGGLEPVSDSGGGGHSVFARAFLDALEGNHGVLEGVAVFNQLRKPVLLGADQTPEYGDIRFAGHEGGDFLFIRK